MMQVIEQTREEKVAMYMKLSKRQLVEMLLNNQAMNEHLLAKLIREQAKPIQYPDTPIGDTTTPIWDAS